MSLVDLLRDRAQTSPEDLAFTVLDEGETPGARFTFRELDEAARRVAHALTRVDVRGERVLLCHPPGLSYVVAFFGCMYAGAVAVPAYPPDPRREKRTLPRLAAILSDSDASLALTDEALAPIVENAFTQSGARLPRILGLDSLLDAGEPDRWQPPAIEPDALAFLMYTSGSTASPKGVMISHANALHNVTAFRGFDERPCRTFVSWLPLYHDLGLVVGTLYPIYHGAHCILMSPLAFMQRPMRWLRALSDFRATTTAGPNFAYDLCVERSRPEERAGLDLSHLSLALNGAEPVRAETLDRFFEAFAPAGLRREALYPAYGLSDATADATGTSRFRAPTYLAVDRLSLTRRSVVEVSPSHPTAVTLVGCGEPLPGQRVVIVDPETRSRLPEGRVGEIWLAGPSIARGYFGRPDATARAFGARLESEASEPSEPNAGEDAHFQTGDLGFLRGEELFVIGRLDDMFILHGTNYFPEDIEPVVQRSHPALRPGGCAVFAVEEDAESRLVVACEVGALAPSAAFDEVFQAIRRAVGEHHELEVSEIVLLAPGEVPKTSSGKVQRRACRERLAEDKLHVVARSRLPRADATKTPKLDANATAREDAAAIEAWLVRDFARRLGVAESAVDVAKPFASFGLPSLDAVRLSADLGDFLGVELPPTIAWDHPSIERLALHLAGKGRAPSRRVAPPRLDEPIAIVGMALRLPGARNPDELWELLCEGRDAIREVPAERWNVAALFDPDPAAPGKIPSRWGGFLEDIDRFDAHAFELTPREAQMLDPRQRLLLELAWEALDDAGMPRRALAGTTTGVFVASLMSDWAEILYAQPEKLDAYAGPGSATGMLANRLSYQLDLYGPSMTVDTACSGSLVATHLACQSLRLGESDLALVGGVNLLLTPGSSTFFGKAGMLAPDGRCKSFDHRANGLVRSDGAVMLVLKRLAAARADGDTIHAVIRGTAVNQNGRSDGILSPSGAAQRALLLQAYRRAGVSPSRVQYVEAHGVGTRVSDSIEARALGEVLSEGRDPARPFLLGCIKTNIGHTEAAAGVAGIVKVVLAMRHRRVPPNVHFERPSPLVRLDEMRARVPSALEPWPLDDEPLVAGVSSFGIGGTNAHVVLEEAPAPAAVHHERPPSFLLPLSAHSPSALRMLARAFRARFSALDAPGSDWTNLADLVYTAQKRRTHVSCRLAVLGDDARSLALALDAFLEGGAEAQHDNAVAAGRGSRMAFFFPEEEPVSDDVLAALVAGESSFRASFETCMGLGAPKGFAAAAALASMWRARGVEPSFVVGQGAGEIVAAYVASALGLEDAVALARGGALRVAGPIARPETPLFLPSIASTPVTPEVLLSAAPSALTEVPFRLAAVFARLFAGGARGVLVMGRASAARAMVDAAELASQKRALLFASLPAAGDDPLRHLLWLTGELFMLGHAIEWNALPPRVGRSVSLPFHPFERERYWPIAPSLPLLEGPSASVGAEEGPPLPRTDSVVEGSSPPFASQGSLRERALALPEAARVGVVREHLEQLFADVLMLPTMQIEPGLPLRDLGIDSILLVEIRSRIQAETGVELGMTYMLEGPSLAEISAVVLEGMGVDDAT